MLLFPASGTFPILHLLGDVQQRKSSELLAARILADVGKLARLRSGRAARTAPPVDDCGSDFLGLESRSA